MSAKRGRYLWTAVIVLAALPAAIVMLPPCEYSPPHIWYEVEGRIRITPPGPPGAPLPAVVCLSDDGLQVGRPAGASSADPTGTVLCRIPPSGVEVPFTASEYTTEDSIEQFLLTAFLVSIPERVPGCIDPNVTVTRLPRARLAEACAVKKPIPASERAMLAPFHDREGRPVPSIRIIATRLH